MSEASSCCVSRVTKTLRLSLIQAKMAKNKNHSIFNKQILAKIKAFASGRGVAFVEVENALTEDFSGIVSRFL